MRGAMEKVWFEQIGIEETEYLCALREGAILDQSRLRIGSFVACWIIHNVCPRRF